MKKLLSISLLALSIGACSSETGGPLPTADTEKTPPVEGEEPKPPVVDPGPSFTVSATMNEEVVSVPMVVDGKEIHLEATMYRPDGKDGKDRFAVIALNHGSPRTEEERVERRRHFEESKWFVERGFAVIVPMRRGYAKSEGGFSEGYLDCLVADYTRAGLETAKDIKASLEFMAKQPWADANRLFSVGYSAGGFGSLALGSRELPGLKAVVNFSGGRGSNADGAVCAPDALIDAVEIYGQSTNVPALWLYSENDLSFQPPLVKEMFDAYHATGAGEFASMPPYEKDGHGLFYGVSLWSATLEKFLQTPQQPVRN